MPGAYHVTVAGTRESWGPYGLASAQDFARIGSQYGDPRRVYRDRKLIREYEDGERVWPTTSAQARGLSDREVPRNLGGHKRKAKTVKKNPRKNLPKLTRLEDEVWGMVNAAWSTDARELAKDFEGLISVADTQRGLDGLQHKGYISAQIPHKEHMRRTLAKGARNPTELQVTHKALMKRRIADEKKRKARTRYGIFVWTDTGVYPERKALKVYKSEAAAMRYAEKMFEQGEPLVVREII